MTAPRTDVDSIVYCLGLSCAFGRVGGHEYVFKCERHNTLHSCADGQCAEIAISHYVAHEMSTLEIDKSCPVGSVYVELQEYGETTEQEIDRMKQFLFVKGESDAVSNDNKLRVLQRFSAYAGYFTSMLSADRFREYYDSIELTSYGIGADESYRLELETALANNDEDDVESDMDGRLLHHMICYMETLIFSNDSDVNVFMKGFAGKLFEQDLPQKFIVMFLCLYKWYYRNACTATKTSRLASIFDPKILVKIFFSRGRDQAQRVYTSLDKTIERILTARHVTEADSSMLHELN